MKWLKTGTLLLWLGLVVAYYLFLTVSGAYKSIPLLWIAEPIANTWRLMAPIDFLCGVSADARDVAEAELINVCQTLNHLHYAVFTLLLGALGIALFRWFYPLRVAIVVFIGIPLLYWARSYTAKELGAVQTYSYELYIIVFYGWCAVMAILTAAGFLIPKHSKKVLILSLALSLLITLVAAFVGRGSVEHITPILGGLMAGFSGTLLWEGVLVKLLAIIMSCTVVYMSVAGLVFWVRDGKFPKQRLKHAFKYSVISLIIALLPVLSVPAGEALHGKDVIEAKNYIHKLVPRMKEYYDEHDEYPKRLEEVVDVSEDKPRLIRIYDYLARIPGAYYLSRPQKYCFVVFDSSRNHGYHSMTSDNDKWEFADESRDMGEVYLDICGESGITSHEGMIAGHLGLPDPDDPVAAVGLMVDDVVRPALTQEATPILEGELHRLGRKDPSIYGDQQPDDSQRYISPDELRDQIYKAPLRQ